MTTVEEFLAHYGVKGMKWGVRKRSGGAKPESASERAKKMTDDELRQAIARMELEQRYVRISGEDRPGASAFIARTVAQVGKQGLNQLGNMAVQQAIKKATR